ncbi:hypothetical protein COO91_05219 [Nostoc flagelliforme CCNUN1]|uniref:Uncharacterized protein n=1 Tax=Nostoc flagelliforme CCNUN1 TaxID=2038116 RepID=A0A2K8SUY4_9NOSO|nr:hypothetical protein COO91_05219 [Nostoc flagelliforme CCNUN1]
MRGGVGGGVLGTFARGLVKRQGDGDKGKNLLYVLTQVTLSRCLPCSFAYKQVA